MFALTIIDFSPPKHSPPHYNLASAFSITLLKFLSPRLLLTFCVLLIHWIFLRPNPPVWGSQTLQGTHIESVSETALTPGIMQVPDKPSQSSPTWDLRVKKVCVGCQMGYRQQTNNKPYYKVQWELLWRLVRQAMCAEKGAPDSGIEAGKWQLPPDLEVKRRKEYSRQNQMWESIACWRGRLEALPSSNSVFFVSYSTGINCTKNTPHIVYFTRYFHRHCFISSLKQRFQVWQVTVSGTQTRNGPLCS